MIVDKTKEEAGRGYQILGAMMPKKFDSKDKKISFWEALTNGKRGFDKWVNVFMNAISIIAFFIIILSILCCLAYFLYELVHIFI